MTIHIEKTFKAIQCQKKVERIAIKSKSHRTLGKKAITVFGPHNFQHNF